VENNEIACLFAEIESPIGIASNGTETLGPAIVLAIGIGVGVLVS